MAAIDILIIYLGREKVLSAGEGAPIQLRTKVRSVLVACLIKTGLDKTMLSKYLYILERLGITEKIIPVTKTYKSKLKAKGALYFLKDNFF